MYGEVIPISSDIDPYEGAISIYLISIANNFDL